jgi:hypothetical protein
MTDQYTFTVIKCERRFSWGITCRLRLDSAVRIGEEWLGYDLMGLPTLLNRTFDRPLGWETEVTLVGRDLQRGDKIAVDDVIKEARLWVEGRGRITGSDRP